jgi:LPS-assembly protein
VARWVGGIAVTLTLAAGASRAEPLPAQVRVLSGPGAPTVVTVRASPDVQIEDRTPGANTATAPRGPASVGETFTGEITLFLHGTFVSRQAVVEVGDALVSAVRLFPEEQGTTVLVFVRQPVTYSVSRPSALSEIAIEIRGRTRPIQIAGRTARGATRTARPKPEPGRQQVAVDAEQLDYDRQANVLVARGGVTLTRGDMTLTADEVRYDREHATVDAHGHVVIVDPEASVDGEAAHLNLDDESGWVDSAQAVMHPGEYNLEGKRLDKLGGPLYHVNDGTFTTCKCGGLERPSWSIAGRETDIKLEGHGVMRGATFRVKDVPVFYFPYFLFPAKTARETGFLFPRIGYSNRRGFQWEQPFFWAINKSSDATVAFDVETALRTGIVGEYRYALSRRTEGTFTLAYYNEQIRGAGSAGTIAPDGSTGPPPENRFAIAGHHVQPFLAGSKLYLDVFAVSDETFLKEINTFAFGTRRDLTLRSSRFTASHAGVIKTWLTGLARVDNVYYQDLIDPQELALQKLPQIEAEHSMPLADGLAVGRLAGEATYFSRQEGYSGLRGDFAPELFLPFNLGRALNGSVTGGVRETAYHLTDREQVAFIVPIRKFRAAPDLPLLDADRTRELAEVSGRLGTEFSRVFDFQHLGLEKLRHSIEPEARYLFVPAVARPIADTVLPACSSLPRAQRRPNDNCSSSAAAPTTAFSEGYLFDEKDAINRRNFVSYGFTTRLLGRAATAPEAAVHAEEAAEETDADVGPQPGVDEELLAPGLPEAALPNFVGPPTPSGKDGAATTGPSRELVRASVLHGYDISRPLVRDSHLSDIDLGIRLTPLDYLGLTYGGTFDLDGGSLRGTTAGFFVREPSWTPPSSVRNLQSPTTLAVSYRFVERDVNRSLHPDSGDRLLLSSAGVKEVTGSLYWRLTNYLGLAFIARYDLLTTPAAPPQGEIGPHFLERDYIVHLISKCNCWVLDAGVSDKFNPDERLFRVQFTLVGLGSFGRGTAPQSFIGLAPLSGIGYRRPSALGGNY